MRLLVATGNKNKLREFERILSPLGVEVTSPAEAGVGADVEETGLTFAENAKLKAEALYRLTGLPTVADDSGLCIDALEGRPGVYSARYLGDAPQSEKNAGILKEMEHVPDDKRAARFICAICYIDGNRAPIECEGCCEGFIAHEPSGGGGFGYDPIFLCGGRSFAAISGAEKDEVSHRGKALRRFAELLEQHMNGKEKN